MKYLKITLVILLVIIILDTLQAKIFTNSPLLRIRINLYGDEVFIDKGLLVNHYHCLDNEEATVWKNVKFACSLKETFDFYLVKKEVYTDIRFNDYFTYDNRKIYLAGNIGEFYVDQMPLKDFLWDYNVALDDVLKKITDKLELSVSLDDGGTTVYKAFNKDMTLVSCKNLSGNSNIYIGDYSLEYSDDLCK